MTVLTYFLVLSLRVLLNYALEDTKLHELLRPAVRVSSMQELCAEDDWDECTTASCTSGSSVSIRSLDSAHEVNSVYVQPDYWYAPMAVLYSCWLWFGATLLHDCIVVAMHACGF